MRRKKGLYKRICTVIITALIAYLIVYTNHAIRPMLQELAKAKVENRGQAIINASIEKQLEDGLVDYRQIILFEKDVNGTITALKTNISEVNRLKTQILAIIDEAFLDMDIDEIGLPIGSILFPTFLSGSGPKLPVKVMSISNSDAEFRNVFSEAGINQTAHQIMMDVIVDMTILTPVGTDTVQVISSVVVAETVIVGAVPQSYVNVGE